MHTTLHGRMAGGIMAGDVNVHTSRQTYTITTKKSNVQNEYKFISFLIYGSVFR